jgi:hypothetical protein
MPDLRMPLLGNVTPTLALAVVLALLAVPLQAARADDPLTRAVRSLTFDQFVQKTLRDYAVPGAVVAIASPTGTVFLRGYGVRKRGTTGAVAGVAMGLGAICTSLAAPYLVPLLAG